MRTDKEKALILRLQGHSYNEITSILRIPKSTLSSWFTGLVLSDNAQRRIQKRVREKSLAGLLVRNRLQTHLAKQRASEIRKNAAADIGMVSKRELLLIGATLYWAEGYKKAIVKNGRELTNHKISLPNSDPLIVRLFIEFLTQIVQIPKEKIKASIRIFEHINEQEALNYWEKITTLPRENFQKSYYGISKSSLHKRPYNRLPYGTISIIVGDTKNFHHIMGWIEGIGKYVK